MPLQERSQAVESSICKGQNENVLIRELKLDEMGGDHLTHRVGVDEASEEDERHEVIVENFRIEVEIEWNESPGHKEWEESDESISRFVTSGTTCLDHILGTVGSAFA